MKSRRRIIIHPPSHPFREVSQAVCTCPREGDYHKGCPVHYPQVYAAWHSKHRADDRVSAERETRAEALAQRFHEAYERLAPEFGYETRKASAVPWEDVPEANKRLMIAVACEVLEHSDVDAST